MRKNKYHTSEGNIHKTCAIRLVYDSCAYTVGTTRVCILARAISSICILRRKLVVPRYYAY